MDQQPKSNDIGKTVQKWPRFLEVKTEQNVNILLDPLSGHLSFKFTTKEGGSGSFPTEHTRKGTETLAQFQNTLRRALSSKKIIKEDDTLVYWHFLSEEFVVFLR